MTTICAIGVALSVTATASTPTFAQGCLSKGEIQNAVAQGEIRPLTSMLPDGVSPQDVLSVQVCDMGGQLYYEVAVLDSYGEAQNLTLNAVTGSQ